MSAKHTPGPWFDSGEYDRTLGYTDTTIINEERELIAIVRVESTREQLQANARLIAAAPELLAALKAIQHNAQVMNQAEPNRVWSAVDDIARSAIAKAEGRS